MADWANPTLASTYTNFVAEVNNRDIDLALAFDGVSATNLPVGAIRWNGDVKRWQKWTGTAWGELTALYALTTISATGTITGTALIPSGSSVPSNGMYLPGANTLGLAVNANERFRLSTTTAQIRCSGQYGTVITGDSGSTAGLSIQGWANASSGRSYLTFLAARGTEASPLSNNVNDNVGGLSWVSATGSSTFAQLGSIECYVAGATNRGRISFFVATASGIEEAFRISNSKEIIVGGSSISTATGPVYAGNTPKAIASFNGSTLALAAAFNVSSVTITPGTSDVFRVNFTTALADTNYTAIATASGTTAAGTAHLYWDGVASLSTSYVDIAVMTTSNTIVRRPRVSVAVFD
jgi:hypothetical protein